MCNDVLYPEKISNPQIPGIIFTDYIPGQADEFLNNFPDEAGRYLIAGEMANMRLDFEAAKSHLRKAIQMGSTASKAFALLVYSIATSVTGEFEEFAFTQKELTKLIDQADDEQFFAELILSHRSNTIFSTTNTDKALQFCLQSDLSTVSSSMRLYVLYAYCRYLFLSRNYAEFTTICSTLFVLLAPNHYPVIQGTLNIMTAITQSLCGNSESAAKHMTKACKLLRPDGFMYLCVEFIVFYNSRLLTVIKEEWPECYPFLENGYKQFMLNRIIANNYTSGKKFAYNLTRQEMRIAILVAHGLSNKEIASQMDLSVNTVKAFLSNIYLKLQISKRSDLTDIFF